MVKVLPVVIVFLTILCRTNVSKFDYFHEDSSGTDLAMAMRPRRLPPGVLFYYCISQHVYVMQCVYAVQSTERRSLPVWTG